MQRVTETALTTIQHANRTIGDWITFYNTSGARNADTGRGF
nr:hypothetical protein [uncultured Cohaesibacter sp.]